MSQVKSINVELCGMVLTPRLIKGYHQNWETNLQCLDLILMHLYPDINVLAFIHNFGLVCNPKKLEVGPKFFHP
jgi:hypothetical protein